MFRIVLPVMIAGAAIWPATAGESDDVPDEFRNVLMYEMMNLDDDQAEIARELEENLRQHDVGDEFIIGALVNAYAESKLDPDVIGSSGERGVFQLNPSGLGRGMSIDEMRSVKRSVARIMRATRKNDRMRRLLERGGSAEDHVIAFCEEIERPSKKSEKARARAASIRKIMNIEKVCDNGVHLKLCA